MIGLGPLDGVDRPAGDNHAAGRFYEFDLEAKLCARPRDDGNTSEADEGSDEEMFILCRSRDRSNKEGAIVRRVEQKIEERLVAMTDRCKRQKRDPMKVEREIGRLLGQNTRAAKLFDVTVEKTAEGHARIEWKKIGLFRRICGCKWAGRQGIYEFLFSDSMPWSCDRSEGAWGYWMEGILRLSFPQSVMAASYKGVCVAAAQRSSAFPFDPHLKH